MINKDHLSPTTSNADEIGQPERNSFFIFLEIITIEFKAKIQKFKNKIKEENAKKQSVQIRKP